MVAFVKENMTLLNRPLKRLKFWLLDDLSAIWYLITDDANTNNVVSVVKTVTLESNFILFIFHSDIPLHGLIGTSN